jgi:DNA topoisomerase-3
LPFKFENKIISENQLYRILTKGSSVNLKGFKMNGNTIDGLLRFDDAFKLKLEPKVKSKTTATTPEDACPKCKKGKIIKGKTAYGCSTYKMGCDFRFPYAQLREKAAGQKLTKELVYSIINRN